MSLPNGQNAIPHSNISVIVQGPIIESNALTHRVLQSVRDLLPQAELILSTWEESNVAGLSCDKLLLNNDPGPIRNYDDSTNNVNRQLVSTLAGLEKASRPLAIKLRTDTLLNHLGMLHKFQMDERRNTKYRIFESRVVTCQLYFRDPRRFPALFHIGDIFHFGQTSDLLKLWDIPLMRQEDVDFSQRFALNNNPFFPFRSCWLSPERYIWIQALRKTGIKYQPENVFHNSPHWIVTSEISIVNNFVICTPDQLGIIVPEKFRHFIDSQTLYNNTKWQILNERYCRRDPYWTEILDLVRSVYIHSYRHHGLRGFFPRVRQIFVLFKRTLLKCIRGIPYPPL